MIGKSARRWARDGGVTNARTRIRKVLSTCAMEMTKTLY